MGDALLVRKTKGTANIYAIICVIYPEGSTCTCTSSDGNTVLTLENTSGEGQFLVPEAGTWTVRCSSDSDSNQQDIVINTRGQIVNLKLEYSMYLYQNNNEYTSITGGWIAEAVPLTASTSGGTLTFNKNDTHIYISSPSSSFSGGWVRTKNKVDLTNIGRIAVTINNVSNYTSSYLGVAAYSALGAHQQLNKAAEANTSTSGVHTFELDVSELTGSYYIALNGIYTQNAGQYITFALWNIVCKFKGGEIT